MSKGSKTAFWLMIVLAIAQFLHAAAQPHIIEIHAMTFIKLLSFRFDDSSPDFPYFIDFCKAISSQWDGEMVFAALLFLLAVIWRIWETWTNRSSKKNPNSN